MAGDRDIPVSQVQQPIRIVALAASLANAKDVGDRAEDVRLGQGLQEAA